MTQHHGVSYGPFIVIMQGWGRRGRDLYLFMFTTLDGEVSQTPNLSDGILAKVCQLLIQHLAM